MKRLSMLWAIILIASGLTALTSCSSNDEDTPVQDEWESLGLMLTREQDKQDTMTVIDYFERNGIKFHLIDITERFVKALYYDDQFVPVTHVNLEALPDPIQTIARSWGQSGSVTKVFRLEYEGEAYYEIRNLLMSSISDFYDSKGERCNIPDYKSVTEGACCILVLDTEIVKSAEGAPNYLIGIWQNDWQHLKHTQGEAFINLYPDLPFSITEVMQLNDDFTGYLRTVKTYKDGRNEVALDPFRYELTDYHGGEQYGYHGYSYKCFFEAGDVIEYMERSYDDMQTLEKFRSLAYFPWFKQTCDQFESLEVNVGRKYGLPTKDDSNPIVGRWTGGEYSEYLMKTVSTTWVFRSDNTGYRLLEGTYDVPFAYTVSYNGSDAEVTIYKYNTGFTLDEGFAHNLADLSFDPTILPKGATIKARLNGNSLELEGWGSFSRQE
jgi:hypothetical protein